MFLTSSDCMHRGIRYKEQISAPLLVTAPFAHLKKNAKNK